MAALPFKETGYNLAYPLACKDSIWPQLIRKPTTFKAQTPPR